MQKFKIKEIGEIVSGGTPSTSNSSYWGGEIDWITPKDLSNNKNKYIINGERTISLAGLNNSSAKIVPKNTVLLTSRAPIGYLALSGKEMCTNQGFKSIICDKSIILPDYLYYLLSTKINDLIGISSGSTFLELSKSVLENYEIYIHRLSEQQHIVDTIGSIDNLIEQSTEINSKLFIYGLVLLNKIYKKSLYIESKIINEVSILKDGTHNPPKRVKVGVPLLTGQNIENGFINHSNISYITKNDYKKIHSKYAPMKNDLVITKIGTLGKVGILREQDIPLAIHCNSALLRFNSITPSVGFFILNSQDFSDEFHSHKNQTVQEFINLEQIGNLKIKIPTSNYNEIFKIILDKISCNEEKIKKLFDIKNEYLKKFFG